ncbi:MAG: hypothetical protein K6T16_00345 [Candidatus Pacearchaeota archaeon]|nr:hypothetical protein [Candidatus Pacearchaeota archaeon]
MKQNRMKGTENRKNKKAQEEVFGFVIIVLIVMIIGLVFFAFSLRKAEIIEPKQYELDDLLQAMLSYTTDCAIGGSEKSIRELARECHNSPTRKCDNNLIACDVLNEELDSMLEKFLEQNIARAYVHGYELNISNSRQVSYITGGELTGNYIGSSRPIPTLPDQDIKVNLRFYLSKGEPAV